MAWTFYNSNGEALVQHAESEATEAEVKAETAGAKFVPPDLLRHSPGVAKFWARYTAVGDPHTSPLSYNIFGLADGGGVGDTDWTIADDFTSSTYVIIGGGVTNPGIPLFNTVSAAGTFTTVIRDMTNTGADVGDVSILGFGIQA